MKVSLNWLKDFVDISVSVEELAQKLVSAGFEVEEIIRQSDGMRNVVLGKIVSLAKHPDADKLQICQIDVGSGELVQIVTGAQNVAVNDLVPVALHNSLLPIGQEIKKGKLRGVVSNGMLCSGEELQLSESDYPGAGVYGILIMNRETAPLGTDMNVILGRDDTILDIGITANRSDCNSVLGIAREVATVLKQPLKMPNMQYCVKAKTDCAKEVSVTVEDTELCPRYMATVVKDIRICPSPMWMQKRLRAVGLRPINNIVDITNYVLIEIGQPMHAFDRDLLTDHHIVVRRAKDGESITALDDKPYTLDSTMLVIADSKRPVAIAGVMGGAESGIRPETKDIVFESAKFMRDNIRRTSRKLNLRSDSSFRFERGIDFASQQYGMQRALALIDENGYGTILDHTIDCLHADLSERKISTTPQAINSILGITVPDSEMVDILNRLQIHTTLENGVLTCVQPFFRDDIENANDLAEEIIRLYGYDHIRPTLLAHANQTLGGKNRSQMNTDILREIAVSQGMHEILTYSFTSPKSFDVMQLSADDALRQCVRLRNPLGEDVSVMRTMLGYSMLQALMSNISKNIRETRMFEIANVYTPDPADATALPTQRRHMVFGCYGDAESYYTIKGVIDLIIRRFGIAASFERSKRPYLHTGRGADILVQGKQLGYLGEVHPTIKAHFDVKQRLYLAELDLDMLDEVADFSYTFTPIGKFPSMERDLAVIVDESVSAAQILDCIRNAGGAMLQSCKIFDIYRSAAIGEGKKSVAVTMEFRLVDRTLTDDEVSAKTERILHRLQQDVGGALREQ